MVQRIHKEAAPQGFDSVLLTCNDCVRKKDPPVAYTQEEMVVYVVSTTGNGDPPDNADKLWRYLRRRTQPKDLLARQKFAVLGLGDSNYDKFW